MKALLIFFVLSGLLVARENPFKALYTSNKIEQEAIPILTISTHKVYHKNPTVTLKKTPHKLSKDTVKKKSIPITIAKTIPMAKVIPVAAPIITSAPIVNRVKTTPLTQTVKTHKRTYKTLYKNYFVTLRSNGHHIKVITKDKLITKKYFMSPRRFVLDFDRLQYFHTKTITKGSLPVKKLRLGSHHDFYRLTLRLDAGKKVNVKKTHYGYLLSFF